MSPINFESGANEILINPRMPSQQAERLRSRLAAAEHLSGHLYVLTSGSSAAAEGDFKWVALSKQAVLAAANGANRHLDAVGSDIWLHSLPDFHVGGLGIWARAHLSGASVVRFRSERWDAFEFAQAAEGSGATLCSLVPTQVHDLVEAGLAAPSSLRAIVVGGAALSESVYLRARALGWPVLPSYGMTEAASQIATARLDSFLIDAYPRLSVLPHLEVAIGEDGRIRVRGASLLTGVIRSSPTGGSEFIDPKDQDGWLTTDDFGLLGGGGLVVLGRSMDRVKIGGELVNLARLREVLDEEAAQLSGSVALVAIPSERLESIIALIAEPEVGLSDVEALRVRFDSRVMPYERIRELHRVGRIPRTELGKVKWAELSALVQEQ